MLVLPPCHPIFHEFPIPQFCQFTPGRHASCRNLAAGITIAGIIRPPSISSCFLPFPGEIVSAGPGVRRGPSPQSLPPPPRLARPPNCAIRAPLKVPRAFFRPPLFVAPEHPVTSLLQGPTAESGLLNNLEGPWRMLRMQEINYAIR